MLNLEKLKQDKTRLEHQQSNTNDEITKVSNYINKLNAESLQLSGALNYINEQISIEENPVIKDIKPNK